jgi:nicotinamidase-related amidase
LLANNTQKEFLNPPTGRCLLPGVSSSISQQPDFLNNINALLPRCRALGCDVIWIRSESRARRDFTDPRAEETILIMNDSDTEDDDESDIDEDTRAHSKATVPRVTKAKGGKVGGTGPSRPPLLTDAYLSIDTQHPPVTANTPASEWHDPVLPWMCVPPDRILTKSWYSAFKDTGLLQTLRGRIVTQLVIVGLMTNVDVLATAADAARHGLEVWVLEDCLGYRSQCAHDSALEVMVNDFAVEKTDSKTLLNDWEKDKSKRGFDTTMGVGATGMSKEELSKVVEGLWANIPGPGTAASVVPSAPEGKPKPQARHRSTPSKNAPRKKDASPVKPVEPNTTAGTVVTTKPIRDETTTQKSKQKLKKFESTAPVLGEGHKLGEGDSFIIYNILPTDLAETVFDNLKKEVSWRSMFHRGGEVPRLVAVQGEIAEDGTYVYRSDTDTRGVYAAESELNQN